MKHIILILGIVILVIALGIVLPAWVLQLVLSAFGVKVSIWVCIGIFILISAVGSIFSRN
ncbi:hypothetical protein [Staphylococcus phage vB_SauM-V1SA09]|nr:hypothetical protein [Staphylococcus phage vB_ScaM-V1SC01]WLY86794.1 hypothetical protein 355Saur083PP_00027 [Staphylococcus phage 355Saur083PP]WLY87017.1 hypothetical protein 357Saur119PP_00034 [Staphylococcus phage 357Saur119PP]WOZ17367.1 hypothetical protein [Staphylococcus phage vB_SauM-V1SA09]VEV88304.1 putative membrane protein [Staphylococcus phage Stab20]